MYSVFQLSSVLKQIILKQIKLINKLLILSFSLSQVTVAAGKKNGKMIFGTKFIIRWVDARPENRLYVTLTFTRSNSGR